MGIRRTDLEKETISSIVGVLTEELEADDEE